MIKQLFYSVILLLTSTICSQNIKSIQLRPLQENNFIPIVPLGTLLELSFDDLDADSKEYQYKIEHKTANWQPSNLLASQYIDGFDQNYINTARNSFNTLQNYTHYSVQIPNINTVITKSGNYLLSVLDEDENLLFTRKFVFFENEVTVGVLVERSRNAKTVNTQQTVQFSVNHPGLQINNPAQEIKVVILKNNNWNENITNLTPTFYKPNQLLYTYTNKTNFWGGSEYSNFDSKFVRNTSMNIVKVERKEVFHHYLYPENYNRAKNYTYNPDINGQFVIRTLEAEDPTTEADYAMMHFSFFSNKPFIEDVYIYGAFNDFTTSQANKMWYNEEQRTYQGNLLLKQGFYNYTYATIGDDGFMKSINGTFFQTENEYTVLVYYKPFGSFFERVIGVGTGFFNQNQ